MPKVIWDMIMSVEGFINDREGSLDKLYASFEPIEEITAAMEKTGAVVNLEKSRTIETAKHVEIWYKVLR